MRGAGCFVRRTLPKRVSSLAILILGLASTSAVAADQFARQAHEFQRSQRGRGRVIYNASHDADFAGIRRVDNGNSNPTAVDSRAHSASRWDQRDDMGRGLPTGGPRGRVIKAQHASPDSPDFDSDVVQSDDSSYSDDSQYSEDPSVAMAPFESASLDECGPTCVPTCGTCACPCELPYWRHRTGMWGEFLYLRPRNAEVPYAVPIDGPVAPVIGNGIQNGPTASVNPGYQAAFSVGGSLALSDTSSIRLKYTRFQQTTADSASIAPPDVLRSLVSHPLGTNAATDTLDAIASLNLSYNIGDVDYAGLLCGNEGYVVNYFGGGRYLNFDQDFNSVFSTIGTTPVDTAISFNGGGIRLGLDGERRSCRTGLLVYGRATSNFVVGQFDASYRQTDATGVPIVFSSFDAARIVPMLDLELGVGWTSRQGRVRFTAGYVVNAWFNMVTTSDYIEAVQINNFDGLSNTLTFDGLTARATIQF